MHAHGTTAGKVRVVSAIVSADLESARLEWETAYRDFTEVSRDATLEERVRMQLEAVTTELRRRVGGTYTVRELADEYTRAREPCTSLPHVGGARS